MANISMSTGNIAFDTTKKGANVPIKPRATEGHFHLVVMGDFSGLGSRGECDLKGLASRKLIEVDRDNLDDVFAQLNVRLRLPMGDDDITFRELDDLHPDYMVERLSLFDRFRVLKSRLKKPDQFEKAVAEIQAFNNVTSNVSAQKNETDAAPSSENLSLDFLLSSAQTQQNATPLGNVDQWIKNIVAPYTQAKADPRLPDMLAAVDEAMAASLRSILHASAFQTLEANWLGLKLLVRRIETNSQVKLFLLDVSREELLQDALQGEEFTQSALHSRLVSSFQVAGKKSPSCLQCNVTIADSVEDLQLANHLASLAAELGAVALVAGSEKLAGCESLALHDDVADWSYQASAEVVDAWNAFRQCEQSRCIALVVPRFLLRLPYGKKTSPIESFDFSELPENYPHEYYVWGNGAHLVSLALAEAFLASGPKFSTAFASEVDQLTLHVYHVDGEACIKPCAEVQILDSAVARLAEAGLLVLRSIYEKPAILIPALRSASADGRLILS